jgi:hypothetical protein
MRKLALVLSAFGFIAYAGIAHADDVNKSENIDKSDVSTTMTGKKKVTKHKKMMNADGSSTEVKSETTLPKRNDDGTVRDSDDNNGTTELNEKTEHKTTLGGKKQIKSTKKFEGADGRESETTRTTTLPDTDKK